MLTIGCHLSSSKGYLHMAEDARSIGADTFQFFTRNPRGGRAKPLDPDDIAAFREKGGIKRFMAHAPYTLNPASTKPKVVDFCRTVLADDLVRMEATPHQLYNMHPGSHVGQGAEAGIDQIASVINEVLKPEQTTTLLLETMAGKGTEIGRSFQELQSIIDRIELSDHVGICLDTCHTWDAGYDLVDRLDDVLEEFDLIIGLDRLRAIHLNDSMNPRGSHKDRHARIGEGDIGFEALSAITRHPALRDSIFILETPQDSLSGYADEIKRLRAAASR
ncbi:MAG: deoxyribonuclease IV [Eggerthellaceae bacterium]|jgi:deoxyribonuclease-4